MKNLCKNCEVLDLVLQKGLSSVQVLYLYKDHKIEISLQQANRQLCGDEYIGKYKLKRDKLPKSLDLACSIEKSLLN